MTTKAERIEAIARAIYNCAPAYYGDAAAPYREEATRLAQAAIAADPVTEDVKRVVRVLEDMVVNAAAVDWQHGALLRRAQNEPKKWSGE